MLINLQLVAMGLETGLVASLLQFGTEEQLPLNLWILFLLLRLLHKHFYLTCSSTGSLGDQFHQVLAPVVLSWNSLAAGESIQEKSRGGLEMF